jgi:hypothetical protein
VEIDKEDFLEIRVAMGALDAAIYRLQQEYTMGMSVINALTVDLDKLIDRQLVKEEKKNI